MDFGAAGTVAQWTDAGIEVVYCLVTAGDAGGFDEDIPRAKMAALRQAEQIAAAKCVGVTRRPFPRVPGRPGGGHHRTCAATWPG